MAKNVLPVDFQDDILAESMNGRRKYQMITNSDGTVSFVDVTEYTQVGSNFGQAQVNATNEAVNESADKNKIIDDKDDLVANSQAGMMAGALAVKAIREELNQNMSVVDVSDKFSFSDPSKISGFQALKYGRLIRLQGLLTNITENFIITALENSVYPLQSPNLTDKVLNYGGWQSDDQRMVNVSFSGKTITIEATSSGFSFTAVEAWYLSA